jgi:hypothetical protein
MLACHLADKETPKDIDTVTWFPMHSEIKQPDTCIFKIYNSTIRFIRFNDTIIMDAIQLGQSDDLILIPRRKTVKSRDTTIVINGDTIVLHPYFEPTDTTNWLIEPRFIDND